MVGKKELVEKALRYGATASVVGGIVGFLLICEAIISRGASLANAPWNEPFIFIYFIVVNILVADMVLERRNK